MAEARDFDEVALPLADSRDTVSLLAVAPDSDEVDRPVADTCASALPMAEARDFEEVALPLAYPRVVDFTPAINQRKIKVN
jgi:hypothetical protein